MKTTLKIAALLAGLASAPVHASAPMPQTVVTAVTGDCTNADVRPGMTPLPNDRIAFGLNFENRTLQALDQAADGNQVGATCDLTVEVQVPHGYRLKIDAFALEGYLRATGQNYVGIEADYDARHGSAAGDRFADMNFWLNPRDAAEAQGDDRLAPGSLLGAPQGPWAAKYDLTRGHDQMMASDCGETVVLQRPLSARDEGGRPGRPGEPRALQGRPERPRRMGLADGILRRYRRPRRLVPRPLALPLQRQQPMGSSRPQLFRSPRRPIHHLELDRGPRRRAL